MATLLSARGRRAPYTDPGEVRLALPPSLPATLGRDAVGVPARHGLRLMSRLPGNGCVFADTDWWWWIVPAGSDADLRWPLPSCYAVDAQVPGRRPRLIHRPDTTSPYTPPIPLYLMICQLTGVAPAWSVYGVESSL
ncbi:hypothetical protein [Streptomyces sp. SP18CS02]|uniref:hypothetical protein n=1 Tax=Streptomyces sp. SP18CS02 TaxID=3002531 RepID=UPI002E775675|nr:hypothetical protein [Streptomyces sp. SP18CS02]MEE1754007.1 hypothetical protein [Streptomyces sp. SP18CS02]